MGPPELDCEWQDSGLEGIKRFVHRLWNYFTDPKTLGVEDEKTTRRLHKFLKEFQDRLDNHKPNTAISAAMEWLNEMTENQNQLSADTMQKVLIVLSTMMPYTASELLENIFGADLLAQKWPKYDPLLAEPATIKFVVQVNGKTRSFIEVEPGTTKENIIEQAKNSVNSYLKDKIVKNTVYVPARLINFVI